MAISLNPYISFRGNARQAAEFYHSIFGGELTLSTFKEMNASENPADDDLVMHSDLTGAAGVRLMISDTPGHMDYNPGDNISVSLSGAAEDDAMLRGYWEKLYEGGTITQPLTTAPWGDAFGMLIDQFGITWLVNIAAEQR